MGITYHGLIDLDWSKPIWDKIVAFINPDESIGYSVGTGNYSIPLGGAYKDVYDPGPYAAYIDSLATRIDSIIDLDIQKQPEFTDSIIDFYRVGYQGDGVLGSTSHNDVDYWTEVEFVVTGNEQEDKHTILHEFGHALGLTHPFGDGWNPYYDTDDTVMSYNIGAGGYRDWFTDSDIESLLLLWGREDDVAPVEQTQPEAAQQEPEVVTSQPTSSASTRLIGDSTRNVIRGTDLDEIIDGGMGSDNLIGGGGIDILMDADGLDLVEGGSGRDVFALFQSAGLYSTKRRDRSSENAAEAYLFDMKVKRKKNGKKAKDYLYDSDFMVITDFNPAEDFIMIEASAIDDGGVTWHKSDLYPGVSGTFLLDSNGKDILGFVKGDLLPENFILF